MSAMVSQITSFTIVYSTVYSGADQRKHQSHAPLAFVRGIRRWPVKSSHRGPVTRKMFLFDDAIMGDDNMLFVSHKSRALRYNRWLMQYHRITNLIIWIKFIQDGAEFENFINSLAVGYYGLLVKQILCFLIKLTKVGLQGSQYSRQ